MTVVRFGSIVSLSLCLLWLGCVPPETQVEGGGSGGQTASGGSGGQTGTGGSSASGGQSGSGGTSATGGGPATGGSSASGGSAGAGGRAGAGGTTASGGATDAGGTRAAGGKEGSGGAQASGGAKATGGARATGGATGTAGTRSTGGAAGSGGAAGGSTGTGGAAGGGSGSCSISVSSKGPSSKIATVGIVEWSTTLANPSQAEIVYTLDNAASSVLSTGGRAPVDLSQKNYRTLLLGLKPSSSYTFHIEVTSSGGDTCKSGEYTITTGALSGAPKITRNASKPAAQANGFVITCMGINGSNGSSAGTQAYIIDADGAVVWVAASPAACSRARMDYEGANMWMMALNAQNTGGEMRYVSMDGQTGQNNVSGLSKSHHDFTVLQNGVIATMLWAGSGSDPESDLVERDAAGKITTLFRIGSKVYAGGPSVLGGGGNTYHANSLLYHEADSSYTIGDRNPNVFVKVSRSGQPQWQFGGNCNGAPAPKCASASWSANHGHHLLDDGKFLFFSNGPFMSGGTPSQALEFTLNTSGATMSATQVKAYESSSNSHSDSLGDAQRLPNGNTLVIFSNNGLIQELDPSWNVVQTLSATTFGYAEWRATMYGPPER